MNNSVVAFVSALPGGYRNNNGNFNNLGNNDNFWSATENNTNNAWNRNLNYNNSDVNRNNNNKQNGFSVRLLRDLKQSKRAWRPRLGRHADKMQLSLFQKQNSKSNNNEYKLLYL